MVLEKLDVYVEPSQKASVISTLAEGELVLIISQEIKIGWVEKQFLKLFEPGNEGFPLEQYHNGENNSLIT